MVCKTVPGNFFPAGARSAVVAVWVDGNAAARGEFAPNLDVFRIHQVNQIFHYDVHAILVEITMIAEAEKIKL